MLKNGGLLVTICQKYMSLKKKIINVSIVETRAACYKKNLTALVILYFIVLIPFTVLIHKNPSLLYPALDRELMVILMPPHCIKKH